MQPQWEYATEKVTREANIHAECKHGFVLISGERDDTLQPGCSEVKEEGESWLRSEELVATCKRRHEHYSCSTE